MEASHGRGCYLYSRREQLVARVILFVYIVKKDERTRNSPSSIMASRRTAPSLGHPPAAAVASPGSRPLASIVPDCSASVSLLFQGRG